VKAFSNKAYSCRFICHVALVSFLATNLHFHYYKHLYIWVLCCFTRTTVHTFLCLVANQF